jgi:hypothetical protein
MRRTNFESQRLPGTSAAALMLPAWAITSGTDL